VKRIKIVLFAMIICCSMVLGTACEKNRNSDIDESHEEELVILHYQRYRGARIMDMATGRGYN
jgi:hypothetical protein